MGLVPLVGLILLAANVLASPPAPTAAPTFVNLTLDELNREKLRQEILQLARQNQASQDLVASVATVTPALTVFGLIGGAAWTFGKYIREQAQARESAADEQFNRVVAALGSGQIAAQASAASGLRIFLEERYTRLHQQVCVLAAANLKIAGTDRSVQAILVATLARALRVHLPLCDTAQRFDLIDLSRAYLQRAAFSGLDLTEADLAFGDLSHADLSAATLVRVRGFQVILTDANLSRANLHEARLNSARAARALFVGGRAGSARFEKSTLAGANFNNAALQSAHFEAADLRAASFAGANVNDGYFAGAVFDDDSLHSIARGALHWREAHFDAVVRARLEALSQEKKVAGRSTEAERH